MAHVLLNTSDEFILGEQSWGRNQSQMKSWYTIHPFRRRPRSALGRLNKIIYRRAINAVTMMKLFGQNATDCINKCFGAIKNSTTPT